ncbi:MAG TPA: hypothetical protein VM733_11700 [Thermoanaerobaculia bacterium]|nr:hypothetical protein [Thermoanaerobaculia bacterium]
MDNNGKERGWGMDPNGLAQQDQVKRDRDALEEQARRVDASVPANDRAATDPRAAAVQDRVHSDHDRMQEESRRIAASVPSDVRDTPIQPANPGNAANDDNARNADEARRNADALRDSTNRT